MINNPGLTGTPAFAAEYSRVRGAAAAPFERVQPALPSAALKPPVQGLTN